MDSRVIVGESGTRAESTTYPQVSEPSRAAVTAFADLPNQQAESGLAAGTAVKALVKSTEVALATGPVEGLSIRNQLAGSVTEVATGAAMGSVKVSVEGGELTAAITKDAVEDLGLAAGTSVVALIKSTEIALSAA
ncbi:molybdopterin-binding protein [Streptomyces sp. NPDC015492]|uniref:TOBE domain-containing protein n=1 Tax=Streptomyces sp. NPDC015492 TaxID=3364958 RepID=UPI0037024AF1